MNSVQSYQEIDINRLGIDHWVGLLSFSQEPIFYFSVVNCSSLAMLYGPSREPQKKAGAADGIDTSRRETRGDTYCCSIIYQVYIYL